MKFFYEEINNNLWCGLMARTSKIAPRHTRLTLLYFTTSLHLITSTAIFISGINQIVTDSMFQTIGVAGATLLIPLPL